MPESLEARDVLVARRGDLGGSGARGRLLAGEANEPMNAKARATVAQVWGEMLAADERLLAALGEIDDA